MSVDLIIQMSEESLVALVKHLDIPVVPSSEVTIGGIKIWTSPLVPEGQAYIMQPSSVPGVTRWMSLGQVESIDFSDGGAYKLHKDPGSNGQWNPLKGQWEVNVVPLSDKEECVWDPQLERWDIRRTPPKPQEPKVEINEFELMLEPRNW